MKIFKAKVVLGDAFLITGRGLVFAGRLMEGSFITGDWLEFTFEDEVYLRKIAGIDFGRRPEDWQHRLVGILIRCADAAEEKKIRENFKGEVPAVIYTLEED